ncbi:hypothetical protein COCCADRAFT_112075 [Bipolaris zeicola 26-R-13]|uniref:Uncharacterized protein n=1 Tax=Cochliobolus carbonum (strain 26-R-13) TaxID=930089 RepID=W6XPW3_COCC2|nr:uncharacterized protein COCCADRAFT_112075 [Bipolaris zeicola 26-R-13]EUC27300.1 hypothetical protein COCCADRAFT_112075 [Bipolaris zeicola 26-R-13]
MFDPQGRTLKVLRLLPGIFGMAFEAAVAAQRCSTAITAASNHLAAEKVWAASKETDEGTAILGLSLPRFCDPVLNRLAALSRLYVPAYLGLTCFILD